MYELILNYIGRWKYVATISYTRACDRPQFMMPELLAVPHANLAPLLCHVHR